ncbi:MAG: hypothetical protein IJT65_03285 [Eubacterium sp.]|nr:hypothetical protein [Eubacterium sp.]
MKKQVTKSVCLVICLSLVISVSAYTAEMARASACIAISESYLTDKKADKTALEKYKVNKTAVKSTDTPDASDSFLNKEVAFAIIPDNPLS